MLSDISPPASPELLAARCRMGRGGEVVLADALPAEPVNVRVLRADGLRIDDLLDAVLPLLAIDSYVPDPIVMMAPVAGDPDIRARHRSTIEGHHPEAPRTTSISRLDLHARAHHAFAVVGTSETAKHGNVLPKKGLTPVAPSSGPTHRKEQ